MPPQSVKNAASAAQREGVEVWIEEGVARRGIERGTGALHDVDDDVVHGQLEKQLEDHRDERQGEGVRMNNLDPYDHLIPRWLHRRSRALRMILG